MKKGRFSEEQIIGILKQHEAERKMAQLASEIGVSAAKIYPGRSLAAWTSATPRS